MSDTFNPVPPLQLSWRDSSGEYLLAVFPQHYGLESATVLWDGGDGPTRGSARWATDEESARLHAGAIDDEATPYTWEGTDLTVGILGALDDYSVDGDLALLSPDFPHIIVELEHESRQTHLHVYRPSVSAWICATCDSAAEDCKEEI